MALHRLTAVEINKGDRVTVTCERLTVTGIVTDAYCDEFAARPDWGLLVRGDDGKPYSWKQRFDGGAVAVVSRHKK